MLSEQHEDFDLFPYFKSNPFQTWPSTRSMSTLAFYAKWRKSTIRNIF